MKLPRQQNREAQLRAAMALLISEPPAQRLRYASGLIFSAASGGWLVHVEQLSGELANKALEIERLATELEKPHRTPVAVPVQPSTRSNQR